MAALGVASAIGDQAESRRQIAGLQDSVRRSMKLPDPARRIDPEAARAAVKRVPGIHSVAWIDRDNLLAYVETNDLRHQGTIDTICRQLQPLGDTLGVIVSLKTRAARTPQERGTTRRNCQLAPGDTAFLQRAHPDYDPPPEVTAAFRASQHPKTDADRDAREAQRIIEASTPEM